MSNLSTLPPTDAVISEVCQIAAFKDAHDTAIAALQLVISRVKLFDESTDLDIIMQVLEKMGKVVQSISYIGKILNPTETTITRGGAEIAPFEIPIKQMQ